MRRSILAFGLLAGLLAQSRGQNNPQSSSFQVVLENDFVRVTQQGPPPQGKIVTFPLKPGQEAVCVQLMDMPPQKKGKGNGTSGPVTGVHVEYFTYGDKGFHLYPTDKSSQKSIWVELKSPPPSTPFVLDAVKLDKKHNHVLFENKKVRVVDVHFAPGEQGPIVDKRPRVIILLTDMHAQVIKPGGTPEPRDGTAGTIYWSLGGSQATINRNETPLDNIVIELKGK